MKGILKVVTDGDVFRIKRVYFGDESFIGLPAPLEFRTKDEAERYIHKHLSMNGWKDA